MSNRNQCLICIAVALFLFETGAWAGKESSLVFQPTKRGATKYIPPQVPIKGLPEKGPTAFKEFGMVKKWSSSIQDLFKYKVGDSFQMLDGNGISGTLVSPGHVVVSVPLDGKLGSIDYHFSSQTGNIVYKGASVVTARENVVVTENFSSLGELFKSASIPKLRYRVHNVPNKGPASGADFALVRKVASIPGIENSDGKNISAGGKDFGVSKIGEGLFSITAQTPQGKVEHLFFKKNRKLEYQGATVSMPKPYGGEAFYDYGKGGNPLTAGTSTVAPPTRRIHEDKFSAENVGGLFSGLGLKKPHEPSAVKQTLKKHLGNVAFTGRPIQRLIKGTDENGKPADRLIVQTGIGPDKLPKGFVKRTSTTEDGVRIVQVDGTNGSYVRRSYGQNYALILNKEGNPQTEGRVLISVTQEALRSGIRRTIVKESKKGPWRQLTTTTHKDGTKEKYLLSRDPSGDVWEALTRYKADGSWKRVSKRYANGSLVIRVEDSKGKLKEKVVDPVSTARILKKTTDITRTSEVNESSKITDRAALTWTLKWQKAFSRGAALLSAKVQDSSIAELKSGYVSEFGTRYGQMKEQVSKVSKDRRRFPRLQKELYQFDNGNQSDEGSSDQPGAPLKPRSNPAESYALIQQVTGDKVPPLTTWDDLPKYQKSQPNAAYFNPLFGDTEEKVAYTPGLASISQSAVNGVMGHELGHWKQAHGWAGNPKVVSSTMRQSLFTRSQGKQGTFRVGDGNDDPLPGELGEVDQFNWRRRMEREADRNAVHVLRAIRKAKGDKRINPIDFVRMTSNSSVEVKDYDNNTPFEERSFGLRESNGSHPPAAERSRNIFAEWERLEQRDAKRAGKAAKPSVPNK